VLKIILIILAFAAGVWALTFGAQNSGFFGGAYLTQEFPWLEFAGEKYAAYLYAAVAFGVVVTAASLVVGFFFKPETHTVTVFEIVLQGAVLSASALIWGAISPQVAPMQPEVSGWFNTYPQSLVTWGVFAPMALMALNLLREISHSLSEHEAMIRGHREEEESINEATKEKLDFVLQQLGQLSAAINVSGKGTMSSINSEIEKVSNSLKASRREADVNYENLATQIDGLFKQLRRQASKAKAAPEAARPAAPAAEPMPMQAFPEGVTSLESRLTQR
jgi:uncharacterized membrane protein